MIYYGDIVDGGFEDFWIVTGKVIHFIIPLLNNASELLREKIFLISINLEASSSLPCSLWRERELYVRSSLLDVVIARRRLSNATLSARTINTEIFRQFVTLFSN